jgi:ribosomal protein S18 acetylase RimI-like enzyme
MRRRAGLPPVGWELPNGFTWVLFHPGDERHWARIETAVGEFAEEAEALAYFQDQYGPHREELERRLVFVRAPDGDVVGTVTGWWNMTNGRRDASLHWLAVLPQYQGQGIGRALVSLCLWRLRELDGDRDIYLHTQTWSHRAIALYLNAGFEFLDHGSFGGYPNEYVKALPVLAAILPGLAGR